MWIIINNLAYFNNKVIYIVNWAWFPITYIYNGEDRQSLLRTYSIKLKSKEHLEKACYIMGYSSVDSFVEKYKEVEEHYNKGDFKQYRYGSAFDYAQAFWDSISYIELGTRN